MEAFMILVGLLAIPYFVTVLWWEPQEYEKMRRRQQARAYEALREFLAAREPNRPQGEGDE